MKWSWYTIVLSSTGIIFGISPSTCRILIWPSSEVRSMSIVRYAQRCNTKLFSVWTYTILEAAKIPHSPYFPVLRLSITLWSTSITCEN